VPAPKKLAAFAKTRYTVGISSLAAQQAAPRIRRHYRSFSSWNEAASEPHRHHSPFFSRRWTMSTHLERRGFTLVELIVVLFVIGLLIALLLPMLSARRENTNSGTCMNKLRQIGLAVENWESGHREYPTVSWNKMSAFNALASTPAGQSGPTLTGYSWIVAVLPQLEEKSL
jgi:prepilin-type N-terminal cleavage/methylation domain-containing protein